MIRLATILWVHKRKVGGHIPACQDGGDGGLDTPNTRGLDVIGTHRLAACPDNQIVDLILISREPSLYALVPVVLPVLVLWLRLSKSLWFSLCNQLPSSSSPLWKR